jgi:hypothetical protein
VQNAKLAMESAKFVLHALAQNEDLALQNIADPFRVILVLIRPDSLVKSLHTVTPVKAGMTRTDPKDFLRDHLSKC